MTGAARRLRRAGFVAAVNIVLMTGAVALAEVPELHREGPAPSPEVAVVKQWTDFAATTGPYGLLVIFGYVIRVLWQELKQRDKAASTEFDEMAAQKDAIIKARDETIAIIQQKRVEEGIENARRVTEVATTSTNLIAENSRNTGDWTRVVSALKERSDVIAPVVADSNTKITDLLRRIDDFYRDQRDREQREQPRIRGHQG